MPRQLRFRVAMSLDGFIAGPNGEYDWIVQDPAIDFAAMFAEHDTLVMGRKTYDLMRTQGGDGTMPGMEVVVFSRTLPPESRRGLLVTAEAPEKVVRRLARRRSRKSIWLFGGGALFRHLLDAGCVDTVEVAVIPVLLGDGVPLLPLGGPAKLRLTDTRVLPGTGIVALAYAVEGGKGPAPRIRYVRERAKKRVASPRRRSPRA